MRYDISFLDKNENVLEHENVPKLLGGFYATLNIIKTTELYTSELGGLIVHKLHLKRIFLIRVKVVPFQGRKLVCLYSTK